MEPPVLSSQRSLTTFSTSTPTSTQVSFAIKRTFFFLGKKTIKRTCFVLLGAPNFNFNVPLLDLWSI